jgi:hypothetical protein
MSHVSRFGDLRQAQGNTAEVVGGHGADLVFPSSKNSALVLLGVGLAQFYHDGYDLLSGLREGQNHRIPHYDVASHLGVDIAGNQEAAIRSAGRMGPKQRVLVRVYSLYRKPARVIGLFPIGSNEIAAADKRLAPRCWRSIQP